MLRQLRVTCAQALAGLSSLRVHLMKSLTGLGPLLLHDDSPLPAPYIKCSPPPVLSCTEQFGYDEARKCWNYKQQAGPPLTFAAPPLLTSQSAKIQKGCVLSTLPELRHTGGGMQQGIACRTSPEPQHKGGGMQQGVACRSPPVYLCYAHACQPHASPGSRRASMSKSGPNKTSSLPSPHRLSAPSFEETFGGQGSGSQSPSPSACRPPNRTPEPFHLPAIT
jgi:hypothetical protein